MCVLLALEHINFRGDGCCAYHIGCANLALILQEMCSSECMPDFIPASGWQCGCCLSTNGRPIYPDDGRDLSEVNEALMECEICGESSPAPVMRVAEALQQAALASCQDSIQSPHLSVMSPGST